MRRNDTEQRPTKRNKPDVCPEDLDELTLDIKRRVAKIGQNWKRCENARCRRESACLDPNVSCAKPYDGPPLSPEENARIMSEINQLRESAAARNRRPGCVGAGARFLSFRGALQARARNL